MRPILKSGADKEHYDTSPVAVELAFFVAVMGGPDPAARAIEAAWVAGGFVGSSVTPADEPLLTLFIAERNGSFAVCPTYQLGRRTSQAHSTRLG
eukprot:m.68494 g.68494  ORF g.68494 m.68494 type:complete len:95 (+) comp18317_c0_seq2:403-687(+)